MKTPAASINRFLPPCAAFFVGCMAILIQVILFREQMVLLEGNELVLSLMLAFWLLGISFGALVPTRLQYADSLQFWFTVSISLIPLSLIFCTTFIRFMPSILSVPPQSAFSPLQMLLVSFLTVTPSSFLVGFTFPLLSESMKRASSNDSNASTVGRVFTYESLGSVLAGYLLIQGIVPHCNPYEIAFASLVLFLLLVLTSALNKTISIVFLGLALAGLWMGTPRTLDNWSAQARWEARHSGYRFVRALETHYQRLELGERDEQYTVFGNGSPLYSYPDEYASSQWAYMSLSQNPVPKNVLYIGSGGGEISPIYLQHKPEDITIVELDVGVKQITNNPIKNVQTKLPIWKHYDAIRIMMNKYWGGYFELIAINQPDPTNAVINRHYTREFFEQLKYTLADDGVVAMTLTGTPNYERGDSGFLCGTLYWTLCDVFPNVLAVPGTQWWFFASPTQSLISDPQAVIARFKDLHPPTETFSPDIYSIYYDADRIQQIENAFQTHKDVPRNTDERPLCYLYNILKWSKQYGYLKCLPVSTLAVTGWKLVTLAISAVAVIFLLAWFSMRTLFSRDRQTYTPMTTLFIAGFSALAAETLLLLFYQSRLGYLYRDIGMFFGVFMLGLAVGASLRKRSLFAHPPVNQLRRKILVFSMIFLISPWILSQKVVPWILMLVWMNYLLWVWLFLIAFYMGRILLLTARVMEERGTDLSSLSGWIDACDCAGGAVGALITGILLVPLIGLLNAFYILAALNGLGLILLIRCYKRNG